MTRILICLSVVMTSATSAVSAQAPAVPTTPPQSEVTTPPERLLRVDRPKPPPQWTYERQMQNPSGTVTNTHRYLDAPEDGRYVRQHIVTNPRGEMTQTWERVNTEEGYEYRRSQTWTNPDGAPLRQHERTLSGSDPYNYTRERSHTLPDGRMINQTQVRSSVGTYGTMERSFTGPNGQTHQSQRSWTPGEPIAGQMTSMPGPVQPTAVSPPTAPATSRPAEKVSWWQKLNPFRNKSNQTAGSAAASAPRRGFSIGTPQSHSVRASSLSSSERPTVGGSQNSHRPSWTGGTSRSMRPQGPSAHANGHATASRPNPGRGPNR
jgi:hypothetical protein